MSTRSEAKPLRNLPPEHWPALLTREHLGDVFSCSQRTVSRLLADELPSIRLGGARYVRRDTLIKFLSDREREPAPAARRRQKGATIPRRGRIREGRAR